MYIFNVYFFFIYNEKKYIFKNTSKNETNRLYSENKKIENQEKYISKILNSGLIIEDSIYKGDDKRNNREMKNIYEFFKKLCKQNVDIFLNNTVLLLLEKGNYPVIIQTCNFLFKIKKYEKEAEDLLIKISKDNDAGPFRLHSELILHERKRNNL